MSVFDRMLSLPNDYGITRIIWTIPHFSGLNWTMKPRLLKGRAPNRKRNSNRKVNYDQLECRRLLAGDVRVIPFDNSLFIRGDTQSNQIEIARSNDGEGNIRVTGVDGTTVNGQAEVLLEGNDAVISNDFRINMGRGDDTVKLIGVTAGGLTNIYGSYGDDVIGLEIIDPDAFDSTTNGQG